jgi:hypothetical protein
MRTYLLTDAFEAVKDAFAFLSEEWGFDLVRIENLNYMCVLDFQRNGLILHFAYDYKDNCFYFSFIANEKRQYFFEFFSEMEPNLDWKLFQPDDIQYKESLMRNVAYLKKYKEDVMRLAE